jgi:hypothetical protein
MMIKFSQYINEKKATKDSIATTATSSPLRGQNQDQSGYSPSHSTADYTISDSKKAKVKEDDNIDKVNAVAAALKSMSTSSSNTAPSSTNKPSMPNVNAPGTPDMFKTEKKLKEGFVSTAGSPRQTPVTMKSAGASHIKGGSHLQHDADRRRVQLDKMAQVRRNQQEKERERAQKEREKAAIERQKEAQKAIKKTNEELEEAKAVSQAQQKAAGAALATQRGEYAGGKKGGAVNRMALMKRSELEKIAGTKRKELPVRKEETELDEARRGRPPKNKTDEDPGSDNIIMQLRKVISLRGQSPVTFVDGKKANISPATAHRLLAAYDNLRTSGEKHTFSQRIHRSADSMRDVIAGKKEIQKPKISLGGTYRGK